MMVSPPVAGVNAGYSAGGGLLDSFKAAVGGATGQTGQTAQVDPGPKGDGSVGLFDGVLKKALFGGAAGAAIGFIPFIPGGPILGGIVGALGGAAMGVFSNWSKQKQIKQENEAMLAAMGVQVDDPAIQQVLQSGNVSQLIPMMQSAQQGDPSVGVVQQGTTTTPEQLQAQQVAIQQGQLPAVVDPSTQGISQSPVPTQGTIAVGSGAGAAINPNQAVSPGLAPANTGGGGSAGDAGRPAAPAGVNSSDVSAIAPTQAGIGEPTSGIGDATQGVGMVTAEEATPDQLVAMIKQLQQQIDMLKEMIENDQRRRAESMEAEANALQHAA
jgi:hypothetical protein